VRVKHETLQAHVQREPVQRADRLPLLLGRPHARGHVERLLVDARNGKPALLEPPRPPGVGRDVERLPQHLRGAQAVRGPLVPDLGEGAVVGAEGRAGLAVLEPAARLEAAEALLVEARPVAEAAHHVPDVDEVEVVIGEGPWLGQVVDDELAVRRDPGRLHGG